MRKLKTMDIFPFSKMIKKMELKEDLKNILTNSVSKNQENEEIQNGNTNNGLVTLEIIMIIFENLYKAESEFYEFISQLAEKTIEEIKELSIEELIGLLKELIKDENFLSFFKLAAK